MKLQNRLYVTTQGCTDPDVARALSYQLAGPLDELYHRKVISGYQSFVLRTEGDYEEHDLDRPMIERATGGVFPAIFLNVTYRIDLQPADVSAIEPLITEYGFRHMVTE